MNVLSDLFRSFSPNYSPETPQSGEAQSLESRLRRGYQLRNQIRQLQEELKSIDLDIAEKAEALRAGKKSASIEGDAFIAKVQYKTTRKLDNKLAMEMIRNGQATEEMILAFCKKEYKVDTRGFDRAMNQANEATKELAQKLIEEKEAKPAVTYEYCGTV